MPKLYRDATTARHETPDAARPAETVAETVEARHETPDVAELRRLYEAAMCVGANEMAWDEWTTAISEAADALLDAAAERDALAAKVGAVREWIDRRGVNVGDRDDDYMRGYRDAQRHAILDAAELRWILDAETGSES